MEENKNNLEINSIQNDNEIETLEEDSSVSTESLKKGSKAKTIGVIFIFVLLFGIVIFLPEISDFLNNNGDDEVIILPNKKGETYQVRMCYLEKKTADIITKINLTFYYKNSALKKEKLINIVNTTTNDDKDKYLYNMHLSCQKFEKEIEMVGGIEQTCTLKDNKETIKQEIDYSKIKKADLEKNIGELDGFYPEFSYNQDKKTIEERLVEVGYKCTNSN